MRPVFRINPSSGLNYCSNLVVQIASMTKSKKYFLIGAIIFIIIMIFIAVDISRRTVAPWEKDKAEIKNGKE